MRWWSRGRAALLAVVGVGIGANGVVVAVAPERLRATYGIEVDGPDLAILLRHRAVMLALIGSALVASAFRRELRTAAVTGGALSMATYVLMALTAGVNDEQHRVAVADLVLLGLLAAAAVAPERRRGPAAGPAPRDAPPIR